MEDFSNKSSFGTYPERIMQTPFFNFQPNSKPIRTKILSSSVSAFRGEALQLQKWNRTMMKN